MLTVTLIRDELLRSVAKTLPEFPSSSTAITGHMISFLSWN